jgi:hypothetical protein
MERCATASLNWQRECGSSPTSGRAGLLHSKCPDRLPGQRRNQYRDTSSERLQPTALVEIHWTENANLIQFTNQIVSAIATAAVHPGLTNAQSGHRQGRSRVPLPWTRRKPLFRVDLRTSVYCEVAGAGEHWRAIAHFDKLEINQCRQVVWVDGVLAHFVTVHSRREISPLFTPRFMMLW